ncbi:hypothetical protein M0802_016810, partial [Mischocyttarus mexicanus]
MELRNGLICDDSDDEDDISPTNSPIPPRRIVPSPPLPPRRPSPSPTPSNNHLRNGRSHLVVPKENAPPPPPPSSVTVILSSTIDSQHNKINNEVKYDMLHRASSPSQIPLVPPPTVIRGGNCHVRSSLGNHVSAIVHVPPVLPEKGNRIISTNCTSTAAAITTITTT